MAPKKNDEKSCCTECSEEFTHRMQLRRHMQKCHPNKYAENKQNKKLPYIEENGVFKCISCSKPIKHKTNAYRHKCSESDPVKQTYTCIHCGNKFNYLSKFNQHLQTHQNELMKWVCEGCGKEYKRKDHFEKHMAKCCNSANSASFVNGEELGLSMQDVEMNYEEESYEHVNKVVVMEETEGIDDVVMKEAEAQMIDGEVVIVTEAEEQMIDEEVMLEAEEQTRDGIRKKNRVRKEKERKKKSIEAIVKNLEVTQRSSILNEVMPINNSINYEGYVCSAFLSDLKERFDKESAPKFYQYIHKTFANKIEDGEFQKWLTNKLGVYKYRFVEQYYFWKENNFSETRGRKGLPIEVQQIIYNEWKENSIFSPDRRNGRDTVKMSKNEYENDYHLIKNDPPLIEDKNRRGSTFVSSTRRIVTCTIDELQTKIKDKHAITVSTGKILELKPFFISYATEKEKVLCMCKRCLNMRMLFTPLVEHSKTNDGPELSSITEYFMESCPCSKAKNGYYQLKCCQGKCSACKDIKPVAVPLKSDETTKSYYQFEVTSVPYITKKTKEKKIAKKTERLQKKESIKDIEAQLFERKTEYLCHRYLTVNDTYEWKKILSTVNEYGSILHMDYSENVSGTPREECQDAHFAKRQYSLHCTVLHDRKEDNGDMKNIYYYHLSNDMTHDWAYTETVVKQIIELHRTGIVRIKTDNCKTQFKCKWVFRFYRQLAKDLGKIIILYYGAAGHGKGLVDAMSGFGLKDPLRKAIIRENFFYNSAEDIFEFIVPKKESDTKKYFLVDKDMLNEKRENNTEEFPIKDQDMMHMIAIKPDGAVELKKNMC